MARVTGSEATELDSASLRAIHLVKLEFDSGDVLAHDGVGSYTEGGDTYLGVGEFGSIEIVAEDVALRPQSISLNLNGVDAALITDVLTDDYHMRPAAVSLVVLDEDYTIIGSAVPLWSGYMDHCAIELNEGKASIRLNCMDRLTDIARPRPCYLTDEAQQRRYSGDVGLEFAPQAVRETVVLWGGETPTGGGGGGGHDPGGGGGWWSGNGGGQLP